jgi:hypothetical protein
VLVYSEKITPRLQYIAGFIGKEITGEPFQLTSDRFYFHDYSGPKINYSRERIGDDEFLIHARSLLFENTIRQQKISCFETSTGLPDRQSCKAFFKTGGDYSFDIFAASFYLLSRYEEYLPHKKDRSGRYAHENSLAFKEGFLHLPLVNIWLNDFKEALKKKLSSFAIHNSPFTFQPTYDIDEAYAFIKKDLVKTIGSAAKSLLRGEWFMLKNRWEVLRGKSRDPYDAYDWMDKFHAKLTLQPLYFFHAAVKKGRYDKNISPLHPAMQALIKQHAEKYSIGVHPSWKSGDDEDLLEKEIRVLEHITGKKITASRQHYIRFTLPHTFRRLIDAGITDDYSMGYGGINGFRASVASPFYWYDLKKEEQTHLLLHPFCFMEANSFFEQKYLPQRAYEEMMHYYTVVKAGGGKLITIWHNSFLGSHPFFSGWKEVFKDFVEAVCSDK